MSNIQLVTTPPASLVNTCAIRENAELKVHRQLDYFQSIRKKKHVRGLKGSYPIVGVLGCMAERLKTGLLEHDSVDFVCGPDAYRDIPRLVGNILLSTGQKEANTQLSLDEVRICRLAFGSLTFLHAFLSDVFLRASSSYFITVCFSICFLSFFCFLLYTVCFVVLSSRFRSRSACFLSFFLFVFCGLHFYLAPPFFVYFLSLLSSRHTPTSSLSEKSTATAPSCLSCADATTCARSASCRSPEGGSEAERSPAL